LIIILDPDEICIIRAALSVIYEDPSWKSDAFLVVQGSLSHVFPVIEAGSNVTYRYVLRPLIRGQVNDVAARVRYYAIQDEPITIYSSTYGQFYILSIEEFNLYFASHWVRITLSSHEVM
jgi:hypothetical protein